MRKRFVLLGAACVAAAAVLVGRNVRGRRNLDLAVLGVQVGGGYASTAARKIFASAERRLELDDERELRTAEAIADRLGISRDKMFVNLDRYGNTSAAAVAIALDEANRTGRIKRGDYVLMVVFGGGLTWASTVIEW